MAFQRALWHSGLTYKQTCPKCHTVIQYQDDKLDFRPWYADGFVYCATCRSPLRHNEAYAIDAEGNYVNTAPPTAPVAPAAPAAPAAPVVAAAPAAPVAPVTAPDPIPAGATAYCKNCGRPYTVGDAKFCNGCGNKLD